MNLLLIILFLVLLSFIPVILKKTYKVIAIISVLIVLFSYFFLSSSFFHTESFYPKSKIQLYIPLGNYYNLLFLSLKKHRLYITDDSLVPELQLPNIYENFENYAYNYNSLMPLLDASLYKGKIYLYFGLTPVLLFYTPFYFITHLYLTDIMLVFILSCFIFILSIFLLKKLICKITDINTIPKNTIILSIFLIGFCNILPFLIIRSFIYEVAIVTAVFLLLLSFCIFYYYLNTQNIKKQYILNFCLALTLCLAVGARPHYVLFVPIFFIVIVWLKYKETKDIKRIINTVLIFLTPCLVYGTIIALYNYFRFDSIFEFGFRYQLNDKLLYNAHIGIKDIILAIKYYLIQIPTPDKQTFFSLVESTGHRIGNEAVAGIFWTFPLLFIFIFIPKFLSNIFKTDKNIFYITTIMIFIIISNLIITSCAGIVIRFIFEFMSFITILSIILFFYFYTNLKLKIQTKRLINLFFILIFVYSLFINVSLLFCETNTWFLKGHGIDNYIQTTEFLFK